MIRLLLSKNVSVISSFSSSSLSVRPLFLLQIHHFSTSSNNQSFMRHLDDETQNDRNVPISVWWEFDSCNLPADVNGYRITHCITEALRAKGIKGPLQIKAFGDVLQLSSAKQDALSSTGINLVHIPNGGKNPAHGSIFVDLMHWVSKNPPPAHLFLITGNRAFANMLHHLRLDNYNILLATPTRAPNVLCNAATIMWHWNSLIRGENLDGKHFNHPPDGLDGSWYGHHKVPLEDPFLDGEQSQIEEISESILDLELRPIPMAVVRQVQQILSSYPRGISVSVLRAEIAKAGICLDKDYYGHKKFSRFLSSVAHVQLWSGPDKSLYACYAPQKSPEAFGSSFVPSTLLVDDEELNQVATSELSGEGGKGGKVVRDEDMKPSIASSQKLSAEDIPEKVQQVVDVVYAHVTESHLPSKENEILSSSDVGLSVTEANTTLEDYSTEQSNKILEKNGMSNDVSEELKAEDKYVKPTRKEADAICRTPHSSPVDESVTDESIGGSTETYDNNSGRPSFFAWIRSWWPFRKNDGNTYNSTDHPIELLSNAVDPKFSKPNQTVSHSEESESSDLKQTVSHSEDSEFTEQKQTFSRSEVPKLSELIQAVNHFVEPELFSSSSFWSGMECFLFSTKGLTLVSRSKSRKDLIHKFQKYGPQVLSSLSENDLLQLLDMLISEKKWLEERPSLTFPFRAITLKTGKSTVGLSHGATGLRSLFLSKETRSNLQRSSEGDIDERFQSIPHTGVPVTKKHAEKSRTDMLADLQKLVSEILREHSNGYNMGMIPKLFLERYGYTLDVHNLGHQKLTSLLQSLPGVKIDHMFVFSADHPIFYSDLEMSTLNTQVNNSRDAGHNPDRESSDSYPKDDCKDSPWEELGPVSVSNFNQSDLESKSRQKTVKLETLIHPDYEPSLSDDDSSDSEGDSSSLTRSEELRRLKHDVEDSAFLQTLESFYRSQGSDGVKSENSDIKSDGLTNSSNPSRHSIAGTLSKIHSGVLYKEKQKPHKSYSFVADPDSHKKSELIDGILQNLKKSEELKMQN